MLSDDEIKFLIEKNNVKTIYLQFIDISGRLKSLSVPANQLNAILEDGITFDGSSLSGFRKNETVDLYLHPDKNTFLIFPFKETKLSNTARFICDIYNSKKEPYEGCPRSNLKRITNIANQQNIQMQISPEVEFFLFNTINNEISNSNTVKTGYYDAIYTNNYENIVLKIMTTLEEMNYEIQALHHEGAPYQYEIDLGYNDAITTADNLITFKFATKIIAEHYNIKASFMPKPIYEENGSGLHLNIKLTNGEENLFFDTTKETKLSDIAYQTIGALLKSIKGITAILNPTINSFKRLVKDYEAPIYIAWSLVTRSALIRVPTKRGKDTSIELRSPDCATNPYLAFAVILQACLDGIRNKTETPRPIEKNLFQLSENEIKQRKIKSLPRNMFTALEEMDKSMVAKTALGDFIYEEYLNDKKVEWNEYRKQITPWELKNYIDI